MKKSPKIVKKIRKPVNVMLDLDNTLIYSITQDKLPKKKNHLHTMKYHKMDDDYYVFERPGLQSFLNWLFENFNVSIWSAASPEYVKFIVKNIVEKNGRNLEYVLNSDNCEESQHIYGDKHIKNLKMLWDHYDIDGYDPYNTLIIDDLKMVCKIQPHNSIQIKSFNTRYKECLKDKDLTEVRKKLNRTLKHFKDNINKQKLKFKLIDNL
jgi:TFIIF-interacting CTD phosphatase-like protein